MYIKETTAKERLVIAGAVGDAFTSLDRAHRMLYRLWEDYFEASEQKDIEAYDAKDIGDRIYTIDDSIVNALLEYALLTCDTSFFGVEPHMKGAAQTAKAMRVHELNHALFELERKLKPKQRDAVCDKRGEIFKLPDEQAAPAMEALLEEVRGLV